MSWSVPFLLLIALQQLPPLGAPAVEQLDITAPDGLSAVFGEVTFSVDVLPFESRPQKVEFYVDGRFAGAVEEPPYAIQVDVGEDNVEHEFEVAVFDDQSIVRGSMVTPRIPVNDEVSVRLVQLYVTVEDENGERVRGLQQDDFFVFDSTDRQRDVPQRLITFFTGEVPFTAALLVDASSSMRGKSLATAIDGTKSFVGSVGPSDQAKLILFSDRILRETPFTNLVSLLGLGLGGLEASGGTALNDAIYMAIKRLDGRQGRKVVIILSDGVDVDSVLPMEQVQWTARRNTDVLFYWVRLRRHSATVGHRSAWRSLQQHDTQLRLLREIVDESGGAVFDIAGASEIEMALQRVLGELREQYILGYYPREKGGRGTWHTVEVVAPGHTTKTRGRYIEP